MIQRERALWQLRVPFDRRRQQAEHLTVAGVRVQERLEGRRRAESELSPARIRSNRAP
jgi:hypothetical protein